MDFSLTTLFVATTGTLQASGGTEVTPVGTIGLFRDDYTLATAGNIAAAKYFYINTGRPVTGVGGAGNIRSDKINAKNIVEWYKTTAEDTATLQVTTLGNFNVKCGEEVVVTIRVHSTLVELAYYNGLTESATALAPCCDCGETPCAQVDAADIQALVDELVGKLQANPRFAPYVKFARTGTGATSAIVITALPAQTLSVPTDILTQQAQFDRVWFRAFAYTGTPTNQDYFVEDACEGVTAVATITERSSYVHGTSQEVKNLETYFFSYQQPAFKSLYRNPGWNGAYQSNVVDGTYYDLYYIKCREFDQQRTWASYVEEDFGVIVAFPTGTGGAFETVLTAALGAPKNQSGVDVTTTTTTSTSTTTTSTTTQMIP